MIAAFDEGSEKYDSWDRSPGGKRIFESELLAAKTVLPKGRGIEIGVGTGVFTSELGVKFGVAPSIACLRLAKKQSVKGSLRHKRGLNF